MDGLATLREAHRTPRVAIIVTKSKYPIFAQHNIADFEWTMTVFGDSYVSVQS